MTKRDKSIVPLNARGGKMKAIFTNLSRGVIGILISALLLISACTASKHSSQKITEAENSVVEIEEVEAMNYAQVEFNEAQTKLEDARQLAERGKHKKAILKAEEVQVVAELAEIKTLTQKADESISQLTADIQSLEDRLEQYQQKREESYEEE